MPIPRAVLTTVGEDAVWFRGHEGQSGAVWKTSSVEGTFFVKHGTHAALEYHRLRWLTGRIPVPTIATFAEASEDPWLVLKDAQAPSLQAVPPTDPTAAGTAMGQLLHRLHSIPVQECPFDSRIPMTIHQARQQVKSNRVDRTDFDDDHRQSTPSDLLRRLIALQPSEEDLVVTHGDFSPANVLILPEQSPVLIDVSRLGLADRYRDLALAHRDLTEDYGDQAFDAFMTAYRLVSRLDPNRLYWYRLLDEFS